MHIYHGILLSHEKERNLDICNNMDRLPGHYAKWNKSDRERQYHIISLMCGVLKTKTKNNQNNKIIDQLERTDWQLPEAGDEGSEK